MTKIGLIDSVLQQLPNGFVFGMTCDYITGVAYLISSDSIVMAFEPNSSSKALKIKGRASVKAGNYKCVGESLEALVIAEEPIYCIKRGNGEYARLTRVLDDPMPATAA